MIGKTLSHYKVIEKIGQGGMGEVYRAEDTNLDREVAIKVLPEQFTKDPQRLARFEREAKLLASLNHPNIAAIYGFEEADDVRFLAMELVPGETLAERVAKGPLPVEEALEICRQIAEGVEAAHEKGVIHRDLKPANVKVTPEGKVKILDFGLAKAFEEETPVTDISQSPTLTEEMTRAGVILGTAAYMSPEQAKGKPVDKRADVFAFGAVLYELLTGKRAFEGETITETIAKVLESEPKWELLPENTPWTVRTLLRRCLTKDVHDRLDGIGNVRTEIKLALEEPATASPTGVGSSVQPVLWKRAMPWGLAGMMALIIALMLWNLRPTASTPPPVVRSVVAVPADLRMPDLSDGAMALSPDGTHLVYVATREGSTQLYLRTMDQLEAKPISGTESASSPFFSPDGRWLGFFANSKLKKVSMSGGAPVILTDIPSPLAAASWGADDTIVVRASVNSELVQVSADGGTLEALTTRKNGETDHVSPQVLPDGETVLFTVRSGSDSQIVVQSLETLERRVVLERAVGARYVPSGHLVYPQSGTLMAVAFDLGQLEVTGSPIPILEGVADSGAPGYFAHFAFSDTGTLVYISAGTNPREGSILVWVDRKGAEQPLAAPPRPYNHPRLSPDGQRLAVSFAGAVWTYDIQGDTLTRRTFDQGTFPLWTPDGKRITFQSTRLGGPQNLFWQPADGTGVGEQLVLSALSKTPHSWSPDGKFLAYTELSPNSAGDIWVLPLEGERKPEPFLQEPYSETGAVFSPDGHWVAYRSNESGRQEIYVQPFPTTGAKWQISSDGGEAATWVETRTGQEIFYRNGEKMMAVDIITEPAFASGKAKLLFEGKYTAFGPRAAYDVTPDGQRFLMIKESEQQVTHINVVLNWFEELKRLVPTP
ncbi:MAG: protein kinase [Acidobacteria bacterium]|nr:protein kinase [Acidobacteriota bacterium]